MTRIGLSCILILAGAGAAMAAVPPGHVIGNGIDQITISNLTIDFVPDPPPVPLGTMTMDEAVPLPTGAQAQVGYQGSLGSYTFNADFDLETFLIQDLSGGGNLEGRFEGGTFSLATGVGDVMLAGDIVWYWIGENVALPGTIIGFGELLTTNGEFIDIGDWAGGSGSVNSIEFNLNMNPDDFSQPFSGSGFVNLAPDDRFVPEPATLLLMATGLVALRRRR